MPESPVPGEGGPRSRIVLREFAVGALLLLTEALILAILIQSFLSAGSV